ncbi:Os08g0545700, partial [Oryza sativa Japonica Group]
RVASRSHILLLSPRRARDGSGAHPIHGGVVPAAAAAAAAVLRLQGGHAGAHAGGRGDRRGPGARRAGRVRRTGARSPAAVRARPGVAAAGVRGARGRLDPRDVPPLRGVRRRRRAGAPRRPPGQRRRRALPEQSLHCRAGIMYVTTDSSAGEPLLKSNMFSLGGSKFFGAVNRSINLGGQTALALRLLLAVFSSKISSGANRPFGEEFRAARKVSEDLGAQLVLGDRPIEITLERAWKSLSWDEKTKLVVSLFRGITSTTDTSQDEKAAGSPYELYEKLSISYPSLLQPLIHERDMFLAWSLKRSKAVNKSKTVVGIIGKGHMNGVVYALISDQGDLRFRDLVGRASSDTWASSLIKGLVRDTIIGIVLWGLYEQLHAVF